MTSSASETSNETATNLHSRNEQADRSNHYIDEEQIEDLLLIQLDIWEKESIKKIQNIVQLARHDLQQIFHQGEKDPRSNTDDNHSRNCTEIHLNKWMERLKELKRSLSLGLLPDENDDDLSMIRLIKTKHRPKPARFTRISEPIVNDFHSNTEEKFDKVTGAATLSEAGHAATHSGFIFSCSNISGVNEYSSGIHHIHFCLEKKSTTCPFFGIYSSSEPFTNHILSSSSVYGWWQFDQRIVNGHKYGCQTNQIFQSGDEIILTLDCENHRLLLHHYPINKFAQLSIDLQCCPFPWKIFLRLYGAVSRVRILQ